MEAERRSGLEWKRISVGLAAFIATPFAMMGLFRILPTAAPTWLALVVFTFGAAAMWAIPTVPRSIPIGIASAAGAWIVFLYWLFGR